MLIMQVHDENLIPEEPVFTGKKWGLRIAIIVVYHMLLFGTAELTMASKFSALGIIWLAVICTAVLMTLVLRLTRRMFRKRYLQFGFFVLLFTLTGFYGSTQYDKVETEYNAYLASPAFQLKRAEKMKNLEAGDLPYSNTAEATAFMFREFPELLGYVHERWKSRFVRDVNGILGFGFIVAYLVSLGRYGLRTYRQKKRSHGQDRKPDSPAGETEAQYPSEYSEVQPVADAERPSLIPVPTEDVEQPPLEPDLPEDDSVLRCASCGEAILDEFDYCPRCGTRVTPSRCARCGSRLDGNFRFCPQCGQAHEPLS